MDPKMSSEEAALVAQKVGGSVNLRAKRSQVTPCPSPHDGPHDSGPGRSLTPRHQKNCNWDVSPK